jgi:hypothetical protein
MLEGTSTHLVLGNRRSVPKFFGFLVIDVYFSNASLSRYISLSLVMQLSAETMSLQHNDNDSLMALQALLNIKRDSVMSSAIALKPRENKLPVMMTPDRLGVPNPLAVGSMTIPSAEELKRHGFSAAEGVRRSKIESALRSKPQRGRKRDDLSEEERIELTRTRNREHAKSTR